jgi:predicted RNA binding protein YcfA (HicA-like mRNA interferase family)
MSTYEKDIERLLFAGHSLKYSDLVRILGKLGYQELNRGQSSGSAVSFFNPSTQDLIYMHKPHPSPEVDRGCLKSVIKHLKSMGVIK